MVRYVVVRYINYFLYLGWFHTAPGRCFSQNKKVNTRGPCLPCRVVILSKTATCATSARKRHVVELLGLRGLQHIAVQLETVVDKELYLFGSYCIPEVKTTIS